MNANAPDLPGVAQTNVLPRFARVGGFIYAVAVRKIAAHTGLAHADVNDVGIGIRHGNRADRAGFEIAVGNVFPIDAAVFGFPHTAAGAAEIINQRLIRHAGHRRRAAAAKRADAAPLHRAVKTGVVAGA